MELLERGSFLATLSEYAAQVQTGQGRFVLIAGEAGIGKTSLLDAFRADHPELRWLWGACDGGFTPRPLGPLYDIATAEGDGLLSMFRSGADRRELFAAFLERLGSAETPLAVVVEDLHWADEATADWLIHLSRRVVRVPALVLVTYRDDELSHDSPLRAALGVIATQRGARRLSLPALTPAAVEAMARARGHDDPQAVYRLTGGNPFYVEEVLSAEAGGVPATVADAVLGRTARLSEAARQLLWAAAVLDQPASAELIALIAQARVDSIDECLSSRRHPRGVEAPLLDLASQP